MITKCKNLTYLDDRPVFPKERACAEAFMVGGREAERAARQAFIQAEKDKQARGVQHLMDIQARARREREQGNGDADRTDSEAELSDVETDDSNDDNEEIEIAREKYGRMNVTDQMTYGHHQDTSSWEAAPEPTRLADMETITGPKAGDIDLFGSDSEFDDLDEDDYKNELNAVNEPLMTISSTSRKAPVAAESSPIKSVKTKLLIEEVKEDDGVTKNATRAPAAIIAQQATSGQGDSVNSVEGGASTDSDLDEIPEEIIRPKSKWESVNNSPSRPHIATTSFVEDIDDSLPDLEEVDMETGAVVNTISIQEISSSSDTPKKLIEVIGGDDMDGLD